jgi:hypothetical protein
MSAAPRKCGAAVKPRLSRACRGTGRRRPAVELHAELQAALGEHVLDLGERLLAQVRRLEQLDFGLLHEVADVVDALGLEAVRGTDGQLEVVDRAQQHRVDAALVGLRITAVAAREIAEHDI